MGRELDQRRRAITPRNERASLTYPQAGDTTPDPPSIGQYDTKWPRRQAEFFTYFHPSQLPQSDRRVILCSGSLS